MLRSALARTKRPQTVLLAVAALLATAFTAVSTVSTAAPAAAEGSSCVLSNILVNPCRPWLQAASNQYPGVGSGLLARNANHEANIGRQLDVVHAYNNPGQTLTADEVTIATRANTFLTLNWRVTFDWASGGGSNASINSQIDAMAQSIKAIGPKKIFLTIYHEPELGVSSGATDCNGWPGFRYHGTSGTPAEYVQMWHNVRARFDALNVSNVVWTVNYLNYGDTNCLINQLWPGNAYVDWVVWDGYIRKQAPYDTFNHMINNLYDFFTENSNAAHDYLSKPWGINEWGTSQANQQQVYQSYIDAKAALDNNTYPKIKMWGFFDEITDVGDYRTLYTPAGVKDQTEQNYYNAFANDPKITGSWTGPATDTTPPTASITSPADGATVSSTISVTSALADNSGGLASAQLLVDDQPAAAPVLNPTATQSFSLDTTTLSNGDHDLAVKATDGAGNTTTSDSVTITVANAVDTQAPSVPANTLVTGTTDTTADLMWDASNDDVGVTGYTVLRDGNVVAHVPGNTTTYTDHGLTPAMTYSYTVEASDAAGNTSDPSDAATGTTTDVGDITPPSVPTGLTITQNTATAVSFTWSPSTDDTAVTSYDVYRDGAFLAVVDGATTSYQDTTVSDSTDYAYTVDASDGTNTSDQSDPLDVTTPAPGDHTAPSVPSHLTLNANTATAVTFSWSASNDDTAVTGYDIYRNGSLLTSVGGNVTSFQDPTVSASTNYQYTVDAADAAGNVSDQSTALSVTTPAAADHTAPSVPTTVKATAAATNIKVTWKASTDNVKVTGYTVFRNGSQIGTPTALTFTDNTAQVGVTYSYTVAARDAAGNVSARSAASSATIKDTTAPTKPTGVKGVAGKKLATITWTSSTDNVGVVAYRVRRGGTVVGTITNGSNSFTNTGLTTGTTYSFTVVAVDAAGNVSPVSAAVSVKVK